MDRRVVRAGVGVLALAGLALAGCGSDSKSADTTKAAATTTAAAAATTAAPTTTAATATTTAGSSAEADGIVIKDFTFQIPSGLKAGESVTVTNEDSTEHTFSDQAGSFSVAAIPGEPSELTLPPAGTYTVICKIHAGMQGTLTVE